MCRAKPVIGIIERLKNMDQSPYGRRADDYDDLYSLSRKVMDAIRNAFPDHKSDLLASRDKVGRYIPGGYMGYDNLTLAYILGNLVITHATIKEFEKARNEASRVDDKLITHALEALNTINPEDLVQTVLNKLEQDPRYEEYLADEGNPQHSRRSRDSFRTYVYEGTDPILKWNGRVTQVYEIIHYPNGVTEFSLTIPDEPNGYVVTYSTEAGTDKNNGPIVANFTRTYPHYGTIELIQHFPHITHPLSEGTSGGSVNEPLRYASQAIKKLTRLLEHKE